MSDMRFLCPQDIKDCSYEGLIQLLDFADAHELKKELIALITEQGITHNQRMLVAEAAQRVVMRAAEEPEPLKTYLSSELGEPFPLSPES